MEKKYNQKINPLYALQGIFQYISDLFSNKQRVTAQDLFPQRVTIKDLFPDSVANASSSTFAPTSTPTPTPQPEEKKWQETYSTLLPVFGEDIDKWMRVLRWGDVKKGGKYGVDYGGENLSLNPRAENINPDGSIDRGLFQINSKTFADFQRRKGDKLKKLGITSFDDMFDPVKNAQMAKLIWEEQGFGAWYGADPSLKKQK